MILQKRTPYRLDSTGSTVETDDGEILSAKQVFALTRSLMYSSVILAFTSVSVGCTD